jgi:hypothetical protein
MSPSHIRDWRCYTLAPTSLLLLLVTAAAAQGAQTSAVAAKQASKTSKASIASTVGAQVPPSDIALLQARVDDLQREVDALKNHGVSSNVAPVGRVGHDLKEDQAGVTRSDINALWNQIDKVIVTLDQLTRKP